MRKNNLGYKPVVEALYSPTSNLIKTVCKQDKRMIQTKRILKESSSM